MKKKQTTDIVLVYHMKIAFTVAMQVFVFDRLQCEAVWKAGWAVGRQTGGHTNRWAKKADRTKQGAFLTQATWNTVSLHVYANMQRIHGCGCTLMWHNTSIQLLLNRILEQTVFKIKALSLLKPGWSSIRKGGSKKGTCAPSGAVQAEPAGVSGRLNQCQRVQSSTATQKGWQLRQA